MRLAAHLFVAVFSLAFASRASASASPPPTPAPPLFGLSARGTGEVSDVRITIACRGTDLFERSSSCTLRTHAQITATTELLIAVSPGGGGSALLGGEPLTESRILAPGETLELVVDAERDLSVGRAYRDGWWVMPLVLARHTVLADGPSIRYTDGSASFEPIACGGLTLRGPVDVDARAAGAVQVHVAGESIDGQTPVATECVSVSLTIEAGHDHAEVFQHGGPVLALGVRSTIAFDDGGRFLARFGYEAGFFEHASVAFEVETDFDSMMEGVVLEVGTPTLLVLFPSISAGIGVVARQLGGRDADAALRLRGSFSLAAFGVSVDCDYWPVNGEWTGTMVGRLSI